jgi:hypothetical protein
MAPPANLCARGLRAPMKRGGAGAGAEGARHGAFSGRRDRRSVRGMRSSGRLVGTILMCWATGISALAVPRLARAAELGVGLIGAAGGNFLDKADRKATDPDIYPGFSGLTVGGGLMLDGRILDGLLGLEVDAIRSSDKGSGTVTFTVPGYSAAFKLKIGQSAWHVPILAKITIPSPLVAPAFFVGPELVFPSQADATIDGPVAVTNQFLATADSYLMVTFGGGVEIKLPLPILDLRVPIGLRGSYAPGISSAFSDRVQHDAGYARVTYHSEWKFAVNGTVGAALYF